MPQLEYFAFETRHRRHGIRPINEGITTVQTTPRSTDITLPRSATEIACRTANAGENCGKLPAEFFHNGVESLYLSRVERVFGRIRTREVRHQHSDIEVRQVLRTEIAGKPQPGHAGVDMDHARQVTLQLPIRKLRLVIDHRN